MNYPRAAWKRPKTIWAGQVLWLELLDFPEHPKVPVRVFRLQRRGRADVEFLAGDGTLVTVEELLLWEQAANSLAPGAETPLPAPIGTRDVSTPGPEEIGPEKGKEAEDGDEQ